jgi:Mlc titration factor MtfA (ptsG expression regulator)
MSLFDDIVENQQRNRHISHQNHAYDHQNNHYDSRGDRHGEHSPRYSHGHDRYSHSRLSLVVQKLLNNKTFLVLAGLSLVVVLGLFVAALFYVLPLLAKLPGYLDTNGLKSLLDQGMAILAKVLAVGGK